MLAKQLQQRVLEWTDVLQPQVGCCWKGPFFTITITPFDPLLLANCVFTQGLSDWAEAEALRIALEASHTIEDLEIEGSNDIPPRASRAYEVDGGDSKTIDDDDDEGEIDEMQLRPPSPDGSLNHALELGTKNDIKLEDDVISSEQIQKTLAPILHLPNDCILRIVTFLSCETAMACSCVATEWRSLGKDETIFETFCRAVYPKQTKLYGLRPERWQGWRRMWITRPRVRTAGYYVLKTSEWKKMEKDLWTPKEDKRTHVEISWYRYFRFFDNGISLYQLSEDNPHKIGPKMMKGRCGYWGTYQIYRREVTMNVQLPHSYFRFRFQIAHGERGHFCVLEFLSHLQIITQGQREIEVVHKLPYPTDFRFRIFDRT